MDELITTTANGAQRREGLESLFETRFSIMQTTSCSSNLKVYCVFLQELFTSIVKNSKQHKKKFFSLAIIRFMRGILLVIKFITRFLLAIQFMRRFLLVIKLATMAGLLAHKP